MTLLQKSTGRRGEHRSSVGGCRKAIRIKASNNRYCRCPTGDIVEIFSALACRFTSLRTSTGGRPMAAPTGEIIKPFCHSENGKIPKTSTENNQAVAIAHMPFSTRIGRLPRPSIARPLLAGGAIRFSASNGRFF